MEVGLRERKRREVAHKLAKTAFDLALEKGVDGFTIGELTSQVGYARRTFANYYSCKEEAITALAIEQLQAGVASLPADENDLPLIEWVHRLAKHQLSSGMMDVLIKLEKLTQRNPSLEPYMARVYAEIRLTAWATVHEHFAGKESPQKVGILVGAAYGALTMMLTQLPRESLSPDFEVSPDSNLMETLLDRVFEQLKAGF